MKLVRYADRPDLRARRHAELSGATFPEYFTTFLSGIGTWGRLYDEFPAFQLALADSRAGGGLGAVDGSALPRGGRVRLRGGLATLVVGDGVGTHVEPNVWMQHRV